MTAPPLDPAALDLLTAERDAGRPVGVAVSGGGDSVALLLCLAEVLGPDALSAVTVDHRLRREGADEAASVAALCAAHGIAHDTRAWTGWDGQGNLQDAARRARYRLIADWAAGRGIAAVALGHTRDDNAETFVMGLARGAGLDGLTGMRPAFRRDGVTFLRPLLGAARADLRDWLSARDVAWIDDPTNTDARFERVRVREALQTLAACGVAPDRLARSVANLRDTQGAIAAHLSGWARAHVTLDRGDLLFDPGATRALPGDFARRLLIAGLRWISGTDHPPRGEAVSQARAALGSGGTLTLHGCLLSVRADEIRLSREPEAAARAAPAAPGAVWDGRWRLTGPGSGEVRALTEDGLAECPGWRETGLPRASLAASPAVWRDGALIAAPVAGLGAGWRVELAQGRDDFADAFIFR